MAKKPIPSGRLAPCEAKRTKDEGEGEEKEIEREVSDVVPPNLSLIGTEQKRWKTNSDEVDDVGHG